MLPKCAGELTFSRADFSSGGEELVDELTFSDSFRIIGDDFGLYEDFWAD